MSRVVFFDLLLLVTIVIIYLYLCRSASCLVIAAWKNVLWQLLQGSKEFLCIF